MRTRLFFRAAVAAVILAAMCVAAAAQTTVVNGKVTLKQADGTTTPVEGAVVDIYRTDVKHQFQVKTNKRGEYTHAGIPFGGTFTIVVSAPAARPSYAAGIRLHQQPTNNFDLDPGDGSRLTLEQVKAAGGSAPAAGGTGAPSKESTDDKAAREAFEAEKKRVEENNAKIQEKNTVVKQTFEAGNLAYKEKRFADAVTAYNEGLAADPEQAVLHLNKSIALRMGAVDRFNAAVKAKDTAAIAAARADLTASAESAEKAVKFYKQDQSKPAAPAAGGAAPQQPNELMSYLVARYESYRLALYTNAGVPADVGVTAIEEYIAAEPDATKKAKAEASLGQALFQSGRVDEAIAAYRKVLTGNPTNLDALFGLGIALAADPAGKNAKEARDTLKDFASKAPATDTRKADAEAAVAALEESMAPKSAPKADAGGRRRRP